MSERAPESPPERADGALEGLLGAGDAHDVALAHGLEVPACVFDAAPTPITMLDLGGLYTDVNDAFCVMVDRGREELVGRPQSVITHPDDVEADAEALRVLIVGKNPSERYEKRYLDASGGVVWALVNVSAVRGKDGRVLRFVVHSENVNERRNFERRLAHMADHDPLTGLLNRASFERELHRHVARGLRYGPTGALLMLDLDHFEFFNDEHGHSAGDELIVLVAQALRSRLRDSDVIARLGGDEFAVLLPVGDEEETRHVAKVLLDVVREEVLPALDPDVADALVGAGRRTTVSIGIARFDDAERLTADEVLVNGDLAMYDVKDAGGDAWARYRSGEHPRAKNEGHVKWAEEIEHAIAHDGFELLAQPIVALRPDGPAHYELLLRMHDRQDTLVQPASFLYIAERLGLIGAIDRWVVERALDILAAQRALGRDLRVEVNLSARTIGDEQLLEVIERRLRATDVPPDRLVFELTETAAVANVGRAGVFARRLADLGCKFALDDFGAGFGSVYYLKHLTYDYLKIDGEFVTSCTRSETDRALIACVVQFARGMGKQTIAEHVADRETVEVLRRLGVDYAQGFYLGRPAPLAEHLAAADTLTNPAAQ